MLPTAALGALERTEVICAAANRIAAAVLLLNNAFASVQSFTVEVLTRLRTAIEQMRRTLQWRSV